MSCFITIFIYVYVCLQLLAYPTDPTFREYVSQVCAGTLMESSSVTLLPTWPPQHMTATDILTEYYVLNFPPLRKVYFRDITDRQVSTHTKTVNGSAKSTSTSRLNTPLASCYRDASSMIEYMFHRMWVWNCEFGRSQFDIPNIYSTTGSLLNIESCAAALANTFSDITYLRRHYTSLSPDYDCAAGM